MDIAETQRIILRLFSHNDLDDLAAILANPQVMHFSISVMKTKEQTKLMLDNILLSYQNLRRGLYAVVQKEDRKLIGYCGFFSQKIDGKEEVEVGYRLAPHFLG